jgi:uncharacterized protein
MISKDDILAVLRDRRRMRAARSATIRALTVDHKRMRGFAVVLTGVRRAGKSTLLQMIGNDKAGVLHADFEDPRLFGFGGEHIAAFLEVCQEEKCKTLLLDEVQVMPAWPMLVRSALDRDIAVYVTGSNASLLAKDVGAKLTGRHLSSEVFPFSFAEYCSHRKRPPSESSFAEYLDDGGFPGFLQSGEVAILRELLRDIIYRDIAERYQIRQSRHLMSVALYVMANLGAPVSFHKLAKVLNIPTVGQVSRYCEYLEDAYVMFALPKFEPSVKKRVVAPRKYYVVDNGFRQANIVEAKPDIGRRCENAVYLALRHHSTALSYAAETDLWECDFVTKNANIQVCADLNANNIAREVAGLVGASRQTKRKHAYLLNLNRTDTIIENGVRIDVLPIWKWLKQDGPRLATA